MVRRRQLRRTPVFKQRHAKRLYPPKRTPVTTRRYKIKRTIKKHTGGRGRVRHKLLNVR
jgi:hypothetical protein